ncbi:TetR/AcrR family transcriptional regulator [Streptomyces sp. NBC_00669]|uniref:TetR/AcrR family transcriptional regulator n=1 Tax=Streptomyces sp. NBC_00669 TaxID=2976011 RepID=UPI002E376292|nr:helix-turn-helix domain-containing protein [Streptomyces sp. NBC_00669]
MAVRDDTGRPMRRDAARNHQLIVEAAREVLSEFGTDATMELIASRAGVGVGTVYRRFPNKEALVDELVHLILGELDEAATKALARGDGTGLEHFLRVLGQSYSDHRGYARELVGRAGIERGADRLRRLIDELRRQAQDHGHIGPDISLGDVLATAWALRGIIETTGSVAPHAWKRHLDIHLAGLRSAGPPSDRPPVSTADLVRISRSTS